MLEAGSRSIRSGELAKVDQVLIGASASRKLDPDRSGELIKASEYRRALAKLIKPEVGLPIDQVSATVTGEAHLYIPAGCDPM